MKTAKRILCILLSLLLTAGAFAAPVHAEDGTGSTPTKTPEETFTMDLFSNAALNSLLALFPEICSGLEEALANNKADWEANVKQGLSGEDPFSCNGDVTVNYNGEDGTASASEFFAAAGAYVYPETLGAFLQNKVGSDITGALSAAGDDWSIFEENGGYAFDFDWGINGITDPEARYDAFVTAAGALFEAAPMLKAALGSDDIFVPFAADAGFCRISAPDVSVKIDFITAHIGELVMDNMLGMIRFSAGNAFAQQIVPLYRCLGLGNAIPFEFCSLTAEMSGEETARAVYGPLYALVCAAQNGFADAPGAAAFFRYTAAELYSQLPDDEETLLLTDIDVDSFDVTPEREPLYTSTQWFTEAVQQSVLEYLQLSAVTPASLGIPFGKEALGSLLFGLSVLCPEGFHNYVLEGVPDYDTHTYRCLSCGYTYTEYHTIIEKDETPPTCLDRGYTGDEVCTVCGYVRSYGEVILPLGHTPDEPRTESITEPTCTTAGLCYKITLCANCWCELERWIEEVPATGHLHTETVEAEPPTATTPGHEAGIRCLDCGAWLSGGEVIPPEAEAWGYCGAEGDGTNVMWTLDSRGILRISGEGKIADYTLAASGDANGSGAPLSRYSTAPWCGSAENAGRIKYVVIGDGVTNLGEFAFYGCTALKTVEFPENIMHLGYRTFADCTALTEVTLPTGISELGDALFGGCTALREITIPENVRFVGKDAFLRCTALKYVFYTGSEALWNAIGGEAGSEPLYEARIFYNTIDHGHCGSERDGDGTNLVWALDGEGTLEISGEGPMDNYFIGFTSNIPPWNKYRTEIVNVIVNEGVTTVGNFAFMPILDYSSVLKSVSLPETLVSIGDVAFNCCTALTDISIPLGVTSIGTSAFHTCTSLRNVFYPGSEAQWNAIAIENGNDDLLNANLHFNVTDWGYCGAEGNGTNLIWVLDNEGTLTVSGTGAMDTYFLFPVYDPAPWRYNYSPMYTDYTIRKAVIEAGVTTISDYAFLKCGGLKHVVLPDSLTQVSPIAFLGCGNMYILYAGSEEEWNQITNGSFQNADADIHFNVTDWGFCGANGDGTNLIWVFDKTNLLTFSGEGAIMDTEPQILIGPNGTNAVGLALAPWAEYLSGPPASVTILLEEGVTRIGKNAFMPRSSIYELIVLNKKCDLSDLVIKAPTYLRGYLGSSAETYANTHVKDNCVFLPLCPVDYRHEMAVDFGDDSTCTYHGHKEGVYCTVCGVYRYGHWEKDLAPHTWGPWTVIKPATDTEEGLQTHTCTVEGCGATEEAAIPVTGNGNTDNGGDTGNGGGHRDNPIYRAIQALVAWFKKLLSFLGKN